MLLHFIEEGIKITDQVSFVHDRSTLPPLTYIYQTVQIPQNTDLSVSYYVI